MNKTRNELLDSLHEPYPLTAEEQIEIGGILKPITLMQRYPDYAIVSLSGIFMPPHERTIVYAMAEGYENNVVIGSRGTSKTSTVCVLFGGWKGLLFANKKLVTLGTGFRAGQLIFEDKAKWLEGKWQNQNKELQFFRSSCPSENVIKRHQNYWQIDYDSHSSNLTVPTNDPDKIRGIRGHLLFGDEANSIDWNLITQVAESFLNVEGDFEHGGAYSEENQIFYTSTIDFSWRPLQNVIRAAEESIERDRYAMEMLKSGDYSGYYDMLRKGIGKYQYLRFDYTDLLIRKKLETRDGRKMRIHWPDPKIPLTTDPQGIPYLNMDETGRPVRHGKPVQYYKTYPIAKHKLEQPLFEGTTDESSWLAEQRNIVESASGDVYSNDLVDGATCVRHGIVPFARTSKEYKELFKDTEEDYYAPLLYRCSDPVVIGVDYATQSDFSAFVVIRVGPLATGEYDFLTHHGKTDWSNVIWAEQHRHVSHRDIADKLREFLVRYPNVVFFHEPYQHDTWQLCRGIGLDMKGGGSGVRDELAYINDHVLESNQIRIYDPLDRDPRILGFATDPVSRPMLDAIWPNPELNDRLVTFTVAQIETKLLYIAKYLESSRRPKGQRELDIGYEGVKGLAWQLRKLRQEPGTNWRKFFMEGDKDLTTNKKDYWAAFIYAAKQLRAHIIRQRRIDDAPPPMAALVTSVNSGRGGIHGRVPGTRDIGTGRRYL